MRNTLLRPSSQIKQTFYEQNQVFYLRQRI